MLLRIPMLSYLTTCMDNGIVWSVDVSGCYFLCSLGFRRLLVGHLQAVNSPHVLDNVRAAASSSLIGCPSACSLLLSALHALQSWLIQEHHLPLKVRYCELLASFGRDCLDERRRSNLLWLLLWRLTLGLELGRELRLLRWSYFLRHCRKWLLLRWRINLWRATLI